MRHKLQHARIISPFLLRTVDLPVQSVESQVVRSFRRMGKRIVFEFDQGVFMVFHLMIVGRLRWKKAGTKPPGKVGLAAFDFPDGTLVLTEAGSKKRASLHMVRAEDALAELNPGGLEVLEIGIDEFRGVLERERHTLKRALTDPHLFSGIGNAYSDEILHRAGLSPFKRTDQLSESEVHLLFDAVTDVLTEWTDLLREEVGDGFPDKVTAFRKEMTVHGRYKEPCPECGTPVQRIRYTSNECNYCTVCQTDGRLLADRALSQL